MCELLALSANTPTDMRFSFRGLARRGGATGDHGDGWGLASFDPEGGGLNIYREQAPAAFSPVAAHLSEIGLQSLVSLAHIRKATQGVVALENCHPFQRHWRGQTWVFAHNGDIRIAIPKGDPYRPIGDTDSEAAFCWMLNQLSDVFAAPDQGHVLFPLLNDYSSHLAAHGIFNCLISNGEWLYTYCGTKLHTITRRAPFTTATLADDEVSVDFSTVTTVDDVVTIVSTEPLTSDEEWRRLEVGEALLLQRGEVVQRRPGTLQRGGSRETASLTA